MVWIFIGGEGRLLGLLTYRKVEPIAEIQLAADLGAHGYCRLEDWSDGANLRDLYEGRSATLPSGHMLSWGILTENPGIPIEGIGALKVSSCADG